MSAWLPLVPEILPWTAGFWEAARDGRLVFQRCEQCGSTQHAPKPVCTRCHAEQLGWVDGGRTGIVYSWTSLQVSPHPAFPDPPVTSVLVTMDDFPEFHVVGAWRVGVRLPRIEEPVELGFTQVGQTALPVFSPLD